jgi:hypothetical protein
MSSSPNVEEKQEVGVSARTPLPWFINRIEHIYSPNCQAGLPDGRYVLAVCSPYWALGLDRLRAAWWVLTGRAHAFKWPEPGDLEYTLRTDLTNT